MLKNIDNSHILQNESLNKCFKSANLRDINENCNILSTEFYLDSFNYFPITNNNETFVNLFKREDDNSINHFYTENFYRNFTDKINNFKLIKDCVVLGSSPSDNYFSNLIHFLPRIFFINDKKINLIIHRNLSNKFRKFIQTISIFRGINISFTFLDDDFYSFNNCEIPQFIPLIQSISILRETLLPINKVSKNRKIYVTREDSTYRRIINEADIIPVLRSKGYKVINPQLYSISEQIEIFAQADTVVAPHGSNLTNIVFCKPGTEIYEIGPEFKYDYEKSFENRYKTIAEINKLKYFRFLSDTVTVDEHSEIAKKYINNKILESSNYYKNLIFKVSDINKIQ